MSYVQSEQKITLLERKVARDALSSWVGLIVQEANIMGAKHAPWGSARMPGHDQEVNATLTIRDLGRGARVVHDPGTDGVLTYENPQGGLRGDADGSRKVASVIHDGVGLETSELTASVHNV